MAPSHVRSTKPALAGAARHLARAGRLAVELMNPHWLEAARDGRVRVSEFGRERAEIEVDYSSGHTHVDTVELVWPEEIEEWLAAAGLRLVMLHARGDLASS